MYNVTAIAVRKNGIIEVTVMGMLADSCRQANIKDIYPGGSFHHIVDPGEAQVFIEETVKPGGGICLFMLMPWAETTRIPDQSHNIVGVFINGEKKAETTVTEEDSKFIVIAHFNTHAPNYEGCSIVPDGASYPKLYKQVYGPSNLDECKGFIATNCSAINE